MSESSSTSDPYAAIAAWYDVEHDGHTDDLECYLSLITSAHEGPAQVLEIGSGTGRIQAAVALDGHRVMGIEPSAAMRARAEERVARLPPRVARRIQTLVGSATSLPLAEGDMFDVALFGLNTFAHLVVREDRRRALALVREHLRPDGILIIDLDVVGPRRLLASPGQVVWLGTWPIDPPGAELSHFVAATPDGPPGTLRLMHFYDVRGPDGLVHRTSSAMVLALLAHGEMEMTLEAAGLRTQTVYGSHELAGFEESSPRAIFVARTH